MLLSSAMLAVGGVPTPLPAYVSPDGIKRQNDTAEIVVCETPAFQLVLSD